MEKRAESPGSGDPLRLLTGCARALIDPAAAEPRASLFDAPLDWNRVVPAALAQGMAPLLAEAVRRFADERVPWEIREALALYLEGNRERNARLIAELLRLIDALRRQGIELIPFKGSVLAALAYGDPALRHARDIDFLTRPEHLDAVCALLRASGYREWVEARTGRPMSAAEESAYRRSNCEYQFTRESDGVVVEPHWAVAPHTLAVPIDHAGLWRRAGALRFEGRDVLGFALEDLLLLLCVHAAKHEWSELRWTCDVAGLLQRHPGLDLPVALERARQQGAERMLLIGLLLAQRLLGIQLPEGVARRAASDRVAADLAHRVIERHEGRGTPPVSVFELSRFRFAMRERRSDRVRYVLRTVATPGIEHQRILPLPGHLAFLHVPVKLIHDYAAVPSWQALKRARSRVRRLRSR